MKLFFKIFLSVIAAAVMAFTLISCNDNEEDITKSDIDTKGTENTMFEDSDTETESETDTGTEANSDTNNESETSKPNMGGIGRF